MHLGELTRRSFLEKGLIVSAGVGIAAQAGSGVLAQQASVVPVELGAGQKLRIAILGCGNRSRAHITAINQCAQVMEVAALCDILPEMLEEKQKLVRGGKPRMFMDYEKMIKEPDIHAVAIVLPNTLHRAATIACLEAGKHVLCEKPLTLELKDTRAIIEAANRTRRVVQVGTQNRHASGYAVLAGKLREGLIGSVLYGWAQTFRNDWRKIYADPKEDSKKNWRMKQSEGGAVVYEMGIHTFDVFNWFIGSEPVEVSCMGGVHNKRLEARDSWDHAGVLVRYANGALMTYGGNLYSCGGAGSDILFGDKSTLEIGPSGSDRAKVRSGVYWNPHGTVGAGGDRTEEIALPKSKMDSSTSQYLHFLDAVRGKKPPFPSASDHLPAVLIARAALMSQAEGRHIKASEVT